MSRKKKERRSSLICDAVVRKGAVEGKKRVNYEVFLKNINR